MVKKKTNSRIPQKNPKKARAPENRRPGFIIQYINRSQNRVYGCIRLRSFRNGNTSDTGPFQAAAVRRLVELADFQNICLCSLHTSSAATRSPFSMIAML